MNKGHGHVIPRTDGILSRCGGPAMCSVCKTELIKKLESELAEVRADRNDWKRVAAIWRDKRLVKYGLKPRDDAPEVTA